MTSLIKKVCCCDAENEYVEFLLPPTCSDRGAVGCGCGSDNPHDWKADTHGCGSFDPSNFECVATGRTDCPDDCNPCGAVYLEKDEFYNLQLHTSDGIDWSPTHELMEHFDGWWQAGGQGFTIQTCSTDSPSSTRIRTWTDSKPCGSKNDLTKVQSNICLAPVRLDPTDPRNPFTSGFILSTELVSLSVTAPEDMTAGNITNLNVDTGDAYFAIVFRVKSGATTGRRRIFDQGDDNFGLILDGTTLKACFGSESNSAQETNLATGEWHIVVAKRQSGTVSARLNGSAFTTNDVSNSDSISTSQAFKINTTNSGDTRFRGQYGDLIVAGSTIGDADIEKLEWYLANRFGLLGNLPNSHPYKTDAPQVTDLTPKEFSSRLATHVFKIDLPGAGVVPCLLNAGGCLGPIEVSIGNDCKTINTSDIKRDCAGNVMFYGQQHPNPANRYPTGGGPFAPLGSNWYEWSCIYRFWSDTSGCFSTLDTNCPLECSDDQLPYDDSLNLVSAEWSRGLWERDCDQCVDCNMTDATDKFLLTGTQSCKGGEVHSPQTDIFFIDPFNALYGLDDYTNQSRCSQELDGFPPDNCCAEGTGDSDAAFLTSKNSLGPTAQCDVSCLDSDFNIQTSFPPFDDCIEPEALDSTFCNGNPTALPNACCINQGQELPTTYSVQVGELFIPPSQAPGCGGSFPDACDCEALMGCGTSPCADTPTCTADFGSTGTFCGPLTGCVDNPDPKCDCCNQGDQNLASCSEYSCEELGYEGLFSFAEAGLSRIASSSNLVFKTSNIGLGKYENEGSSANNGFISFTTLDASTVASALAPAGCPPATNLDCPEFRYPLDSGIDDLKLDCGSGTGPNGSLGYHTVRVAWVLRRRRGTHSPPYPFLCSDGQTIIGTYRRYANDGHDPRGTYSAFGNTPSYAPQTITVS